MKKTISLFSSVYLIIGLLSVSAEAAIALDRTRVIFNGGQKNMVVNIRNESQQDPYLAQAWLEDQHGQKISSPLTVLPPLQRVEPDKDSMIRITTTNVSLLPQDRESLFYFNVREIPPKSDRPNVMQIALQTKVKLFYRPASIVPEKNSRQDEKLVLRQVSGGYQVENPTPYYMTIIAITGGETQKVGKDFEPVMVAPKSSAMVKSAVYKLPYVTTINDFGGKPVLAFPCQGNVCRAK